MQLLAIAGTRPEVLKLAPVIRALRDSTFEVRTCFSGQHREILQSVLGDLDVKPDVEYRAPEVDLTLTQSYARLLTHLASAISTISPDGVVVQGDTNTVLAGAVAAFHMSVPVFHVEAGLRTTTPLLPFPEEMNRRMTSRIASLHFAPTEQAKNNLLAEGVSAEQIVVTGNTIIDTLQIYAQQESADAQALPARYLLVTLHRRENKPHVAEVTAAMRELVLERDDVDVCWLLHLNDIRAEVLGDLLGHPRIHLIEPQSYSAFVHLMKRSTLILTDSGGVQEEAPALGRPVLVLRDETERPEAVEAGSAEVVGCHRRRLLERCRHLLSDDAAYARMSTPRFPFGDGQASKRIVRALERFYAGSPR